MVIKIGLLGLGTVGSGIYEILSNNQKYFKEMFGEEVLISKILVRDLNKKRVVSVPKALLTSDVFEILDDPDISIVVEVIGGDNEAYTYIKYSLDRGKHVVTANKAVVAKHMKDLLLLSDKKNKAFLFEASVGGGIPIIKPLKQHVRINEINEIKGILNGTTNFILTKMWEDNLNFQDALDLAKKLGYAEADPTDDIEGYDVARKLAILSSIAFKNETRVENIQCRGISSISPYDIKIFKSLKCSVKLLGKSAYNNNILSASVEPVLINENSQYALVKDAFNIVSVTGNLVGELQFYGQGAGKNPTANAVVCDIIDVLNDSYRKDSLKPSHLHKSPNTSFVCGNYYFRVTPKRPEDLAQVLDLLKSYDLIYDLIEKEKNLVLITKEMTSKQIEKVLEKIKKFAESCSYIRIEDAASSIF